MFSLIISIIAIILVVCLAVAGLYYGGFVAADGQGRAKEAQWLNESAQISGAAAAFYAENSQYAPDIPTLIENNYLTANPSSGTWSSFEDTAYLSNIPEARCKALNAKQGIYEAPKCSDPAIFRQTVCCVNDE